MSVDWTDQNEQLINTAVGRNELKVGHSLELCTTTVKRVRTSYRNDNSKPQVIFVDTPALEYDRPQTVNELMNQLEAWMRRA